MTDNKYYEKPTKTKLGIYGQLKTLWELFIWGVSAQHKLNDKTYIFELEELECIKSMVEIHRLASYQIEQFMTSRPPTWTDKIAWRTHTYIWTQCTRKLIDAAVERSLGETKNGQVQSHA